MGALKGNLSSPLGPAVLLLRLECNRCSTAWDSFPGGRPAVFSIGRQFGDSELSSRLGDQEHRAKLGCFAPPKLVSVEALEFSLGCVALVTVT